MRFEGAAGALRAEVLERHFFGRRTVRLEADGNADVDALVDAAGARAAAAVHPAARHGGGPRALPDGVRHQRGSVAAPTAGLHFTPEILAALAAGGVERAEVTLHVGYGTFKPVRTETVESHVVDPEPYVITADAAAAINRAVAERRRVIAVGTTTTRALEDAAIRGGGQVRAGAAEATTFIHPGFDFQVVGGLLTNFHLPKSSLLMLVAAFAGRERVLAAYREAVARRYRFY